MFRHIGIACVMTLASTSAGCGWNRPQSMREGATAVALRAPRKTTGYFNPHYEELGRIIPGFAGYAYLNGTRILVVNLTDLSFADSATRFVAREFAEPSRTSFDGGAQIAIRKVKYSYFQLADWADSVAKASTNFALVSLGVDEARNRVYVAFADTPSPTEIQAAMRTAGIPDDVYDAQVGVHIVLDR